MLRDLIKDQIEKMARLLAEALSELLKINNSSDGDDSTQAIIENLEKGLGIEVNQICNLRDEHLSNWLKENHFNAAHVEKAAKIVYILAMKEKDNSKKNSKLNKAIELLDIADAFSDSVSFERMKIKNEISKLINL